MDRNTTHWFLGLLWTLHIEPFGGNSTLATLRSFFNSPIDPRCRASEVQHPPKLRLLSKQMIFIWSKDTQKKGARNATFFRANLELQDCRRSQLYDVVHVVKLIIVIYWESNVMYYWVSRVYNTNAVSSISGAFIPFVKSSNGIIIPSSVETKTIKQCLVVCWSPAKDLYF